MLDGSDGRSAAAAQRGWACEYCDMGNLGTALECRGCGASRFSMDEEEQALLQLLTDREAEALLNMRENQQNFLAACDAPLDDSDSELQSTGEFVSLRGQPESLQQPAASAPASRKRLEWAEEECSGSLKSL